MATRIRRCLDGYRLRREASRGQSQPGNAISFPTVIDENYSRYFTFNGSIDLAYNPLPGQLSFFNDPASVWKDDSGVAQPYGLFLIDNSPNFITNNAGGGVRLGANSRQWEYKAISGSNVDRTKGFRINGWVNFLTTVNNGQYELDTIWDSANLLGFSINPILAPNRIGFNAFNPVSGIVTGSIPWMVGVPIHFDVTISPNGQTLVKANGIVVLNYSSGINVNNPTSPLTIALAWNDTIDQTVQVGGYQWRGFRV